MFENIIGNDGSKEILNNIIISNTISHSYIFSGISGIGKFLFAKEFAKAVLCLNNTIKPCGYCKSCESFENLNNPDVIIIDEQEESIKTEQIKKLANSVLEKPIQGSRKVYIINNSENMTKEAQNSLLKTLEEPPKYVVIILVTSNENLLLNTIKSRCIKILFNKLSDNEIKEYFLKKSENIDDSIINVFGGSIDKALKLKDKEGIYNKVAEIFNKIEDMNELQILNIKNIIFTDKEEVYSILEYINTILYDKVLRNIEYSDKYQKCIEFTEKAKLKLIKNSNYDMTIDNYLLEIERSLKSNG